MAGRSEGNLALVRSIFASRYLGDSLILLFLIVVSKKKREKRSRRLVLAFGPHATWMELVHK